MDKVLPIISRVRKTLFAAGFNRYIFNTGLLHPAFLLIFVAGLGHITQLTTAREQASTTWPWSLSASTEGWSWA